MQFTLSQVGALPATSNAYGILGGYDIDSIMQYNFQPSWYMPDRPGLPNPCRRRDSVYDLSNTDKVVIDALYQPDLNKTPERVAFIDHAKAVAAGAPITILAAPSQRADIEQALLSFQSRIGRLEPISIQVFLHPGDKDVVLRTVKHLGYPLLDQSGRPIRSIGHPTEWLQGFSTNTLLFTSDVSPEDVRYVALALHEAGIGIRSIEPYYPAVNNGYTRRTHLIQIGAEIRNKTRGPLSVDDILTKPLPMYGQTAQ